MSDYLDRLETQLTRLTEQGAHERRAIRHPAGAPAATRRGRRTPAPRRPRRRPPRWRSEALALLFAAGVVAAVVAIVLGNVHSGKPQPTAASASHSATTPKAHTATTPSNQTHTGAVAAALPARLAPQSFTAIGELTWWVLGPSPCPPASEKSPCGSIARTTNGGRSFVGVPTPQAPLSNDGSAPGYTQIRFADPRNGYAYGPDLYATHNGGETWHPVNLGGKVTELAISGGTAYATVEPANGTGQLMRSPVSHDGWSTVSAAGAASAGLWVQGSDVIVQAGAGTGPGSSVLVSQDDGASFTAHPSPSPGFPCQLEAPTPPVLWAECPTGTRSGVWRSTDLGASFTAVVSTGLPLPNSAAFAAASDSTAVVGYQKLYRTTDNGSTWNPVQVPGVVQWSYLGFTDATHGVAIGYVGSTTPANQRLYYTTDAGQSYHQVPVP